MDELKKLSANITFLVSNWDKIIDEQLHKFDSDFIDINRDQMMEGQQSSGDIIGLLSNPDYIATKKALGSKAAPLMDFNLEGDFQDAMFIDKSFGIDSRDKKRDKLVGIAPDIFGVQDNRLETFANDQIVYELPDNLLNKIMYGI